MEEVTRNKDIKRGLSQGRTIWTLHHSWIRGPSVVYTALSIHRVDKNGITERKENAILQVIQYVQARMGHGS